MNFEELQKQWQDQKPSDSIMIRPELLLREVKRNKENFEGMIFWRDVREAGGAFFFMLFFVYLGIKTQSWSAYLVAAACLFVGSFFIVDRKLQKKPRIEDPLRRCIESSLAQVQHQIWLLKNVLWWYLSPLVIASLIAGIPPALRTTNNWPDFLSEFTMNSLWIWIVISVGVYQLNQYVVRKTLEPRRKELQQLLETLDKDPVENQ